MSLAQSYINRRYEDHLCERWWAHPWILVGGSINDAADYQQLVDSFGIRGVVSVETEHVDDGIVPADRLWYVPFPDNGVDPGPDVWHRVIAGAKAAFEIDRSGNPTPIYVHCQMGGSRSPAAAYVVMRALLLMSDDGALTAIRRTRSSYGAHQFHQTYLNSARRALGETP